MTKYGWILNAAMGLVLMGFGGYLLWQEIKTPPSHNSHIYSAWTVKVRPQLSAFCASIFLAARYLAAQTALVCTIRETVKVCFVEWMPTPALTRLYKCLLTSPLRASVCQVLGLSTEEKMRGVDAGSHVAPMANEQTVRNLAVMKFPTHTMHRALSSIMENKRGLAVSARQDVARPEPAGFRFIDAAPKALRLSFGQL